ncbi:hypothetical protein RND81_03G010400 [Saponaria officinalis]|uniref:CCHC-type domain-containing protein n=1 Tax=Saponaria officinalis TaxID=3572 RepID=A0AAW1M1S6_SAPOF
MRRLEDAVIALANNANHRGVQQQQTIFDKFSKHHPPTYEGTCDPVVLEAWIREMEKLFIATLCPEDQKVGIASYYLQREADNWWSISRAVIQKEREFLRLEQGDLSVQAYADKFMELSRFETTIVPDEASRVKRFEKKLTPKVRTVLAGTQSVTFQTKRPKFKPKPSGDHTSGTPTMICFRCRKPYHPGKKCDGTPIVYYTCKEPGHKSYACPKKPAGAVRSTGSGSGSGSQAQKGRIFVMTRVEAENHPSVNSGIFLINSVPAFNSLVPISLDIRIFTQNLSVIIISKIIFLVLFL